MKQKDCSPQIRKALEKHKKALGIVDPSKAVISLLGLGENNINYLVKIENKKFNFRIAMYPHIKKNMAREFKMLKELPKGIGPKPLVFDNSKTPFVYSILSYIEGKKVSRWNDSHLTRYARTLASLHKRQKGYCKANKKTLDICRHFEDDLKGYVPNTKGLLSDTTLVRVLPGFRSYLKANNHLFTALRRFSLCHMDPCPDNILFSKENVRLIDWEWSAYFDNALDVAMLYDEESATPPWTILLKGRRKDLFLNTYLRHFPDKTLRQRIDVWKNYNLLLGYVFLLWRLNDYDPKKSNRTREEYRQIAEKSRKRLLKRFG